MKNYTFFGKNIRKTGEFYFTNLSFCYSVIGYDRHKCPYSGHIHEVTVKYRLLPAE